MRARFTKLRKYVGAGGLGPFMVRAAAGSAVVQAAGMLLGFLVGVQLARGLGVEGYGVYGIAMAVIAIAGIPGEFGLPQLVMREVAAADARKDSAGVCGVLDWANRISLALGFGLAATVALVGYWAVHPHSPGLAWALVVGSPMIPLVALTRIRGAALQGLGHIARGQIPAGIVRPLSLSALLLGLFAWWPNADAGAAMALNCVALTVALLSAHIWLRTRLPRSAAQISTCSSRDWLSSAVPMAMTEGMRLTQSQIGVLVLGIMVATAEVGLFRVALSTAVMVGVPITLGNLISGPMLARLHSQGDRERLQTLCTRSAQFMSGGVLILFLPILLAGSELIRILFGEEFIGATPALLVLCLGYLLSAWFGPNAMLLNMTGHEGRVTRAMAFALAGNIAGLVVLVPWLGQIGAALAATLGLATWNGLLWWDARNILKIDTSVVPFPTRGGSQIDC